MRLEGNVLPAQKRLLICVQIFKKIAFESPSRRQEKVLHFCHACRLDFDTIIVAIFSNAWTILTFQNFVVFGKQLERTVFFPVVFQNFVNVDNSKFETKKCSFRHHDHDGRRHPYHRKNQQDEPLKVKIKT